MKSFILSLTAFLVSASAMASTVYTCNSPDFNPKRYDGQSLRVTLDKKNEVLESKKNKGSWFCGFGQDREYRSCFAKEKSLIESTMPISAAMNPMPA